MNKKVLSFLLGGILISIGGISYLLQDDFKKIPLTDTEAWANKIVGVLAHEPEPEPEPQKVVLTRPWLSGNDQAVGLRPERKLPKRWTRKKWDDVCRGLKGNNNMEKCESTEVSGPIAAPVYWYYKSN